MMSILKKSGRVGLMALCLSGGVIAAGCSDSPADTTGDQASVSMRGEMAATAVGMTVQKGDPSVSIASSGAYADSLRISRVRVLISELKLHRDKEDTVGDKPVKVGPMMISIDSAGATAFATGTVPPGSYDKLKFEFHRFSSNEVAGYLNDIIFAPFVTNERSTFVIDGTVYSGGQATAFQYKSDVTANLEFKFDAPLTLAAGSNTVIAVVVDPILIFKDGRVLDPRDPANESKIDNAIKASIKALRKG